MLRKFEDDKVVLINYTTYNADLPKENQFILSPTGNLDEAAKNLFRILRLADNFKADVLLAERLPNFGLGLAINDRLERAQFIMK
jgi:L-threonylcarbamoyladenylate synthase